jgi:hypothetical protein
VSGLFLGERKRKKQLKGREKKEYQAV